MTDGYDCYQNALAERVNGILKGELLHHRVADLAQARQMVRAAKTSAHCRSDCGAAVVSVQCDKSFAETVVRGLGKARVRASAARNSCTICTGGRAMPALAYSWRSIMPKAGSKATSGAPVAAARLSRSASTVAMRRNPSRSPAVWAALPAGRISRRRGL